MESPAGSLIVADVGEAVSAALVMGSQFKCGHAAALLDDEGAVRDCTMFAGPIHTEESALDWAERIVREDPLVRFMVLFSVVAAPPDEIREDDIRRFDEMRRGFSLIGVDVVDWLITDGEKVRAMSVTVGAETWVDGLLPDPDPELR